MCGQLLGCFFSPQNKELGMRKKTAVHPETSQGARDLPPLCGVPGPWHLTAVGRSRCNGIQGSGALLGNRCESGACSLHFARGS